MDSDDDLPPPPPPPLAKQPAAAAGAINLDDSDDDLPPPPPAAAKQPEAGAGGPAPRAVVNLDSDDEDGLPPPPKTASSYLPDSSDDDLPPPPKAAGTAAAPRTVNLDDDDDGLPPTPPAATASPSKTAAAPAQAPASPSAQPTTQPAAAADATRARQDSQAFASPRQRTATIKRQNPNAVYRDGFLLKQQPTWPYSAQKRWCVLKGRLLAYFEGQSTTKPSGSLDLKGATVHTYEQLGKEAKRPHSFGVQGASGATGSGTNQAGRLFVFSANSKDEYDAWLDSLMLVTSAPGAAAALAACDPSAAADVAAARAATGLQAADAELHWFEKMAQGIY